MVDLNGEDPFGKLPDHLLIEILIRVPVVEWGLVSSVSTQWANLFQQECLWKAALITNFPLAPAAHAKTWPGPIPRGLSKRRFAALYVSKHLFSVDGEMDEIVGHTYLYLKDQLEITNTPAPSVILHGTVIDQFIACGMSREKAHDLASMIWLAVIENLEESKETFMLLKRLAAEGDEFLPFPYSRSYKVLWKVFDKLLTDLRDCFTSMEDYYDVLGCAKHKFQPIPSTWLGY
ncbi:hypothetical protein OSB04_004527 [Centaurea solstitialis]|uniref:F-box domain-containing protein n=1 Tax=Centaurea solstitialis TaxID=347529 RepID=A0AA38U987_9ASTR|nr:hypothetical protein OSB04_004527 [Centaurea solstitialis]